MSVVEHPRPAARQGRFFWSFNNAIGTVGLAAGVLFLVLPDIDLQFTRLFYRPGVGFAGQGELHAVILRWAFVLFYYICVAGAAVGIIRTRLGRRTWLGLAAKQWLFLAVCLGAGPGLVANVLLKEQLGRARPKHVVAFGGDKAFSPPLLPGRECAHACSFVSGEAASVFTPFYAAALLLPRWSLPLAAVGTAAGLAAGLVRISQGAHFLSDVVFAGVFMGLTVLIVYRLMFGPRWVWTPAAPPTFGKPASANGTRSQSGNPGVGIVLPRIWALGVSLAASVASRRSPSPARSQQHRRDRMARALRALPPR